MKALKRVLWVVLVLVLLALVVVFDFLRRSGQFADLEPHFAGTCTPIPLTMSAEDIQIDRAGGFAYLSALDWRAQFAGRNVVGTVLRIDLNAAPFTATPALVEAPPGFRPHGMSLHVAGDGTQRLFVVNHPADAPHTVEIFDRSADGRFAHAQTVNNPWLIQPNAVVAIGPKQFYVVNDSGAHSTLERASEVLLYRPLARIAYYNNGTMEAVGPNIAGGTGIAARADGRQIYVSESNGHAVLIFDRGVATGDLKLRERIEIGNVVDNLQVAEDGALWVAAHPQLIALARHHADAKKPAPTRILRIDPDPATKQRVTEIYVNTGEEISAGSVAAVRGKLMLMGSITDHKALACTRN